MAEASLAEISRVCKTCGVEKLIDNFAPEKKSRNGRKARCRTCVLVRQKELLVKRQAEFAATRQDRLTCRDCGKTKRLDEFNRNPSTYTGYAVLCRDCVHVNRSKVLVRRRSSNPPRTTKTCPKCNTTKSRDGFHANNWERDGLSRYCKVCASEIGKAINARNKDIITRWRTGVATAEELNIECRDTGGRCSLLARSPLRFFAGRIITSAKHRAPEGFTLTKEWLTEKFRGCCEATGLPFDFSIPNGPFSPSIDRIIPGGPYTESNTRVVCRCFNFARGDWSDEDVLRMARALVTKSEAAF